MHDTSLLSSNGDEGRLFANAIKRLFDIVISASALLLTAPLLAVIALLVAIRDPGPALYHHKRIGKDGRAFSCLKFRTMVCRSNEVLEETLEKDESARIEWETHRKLPHDPRIIGRLGRVLRATGLDELPQLWNILRGDMSFVGPRPVTDEELAYYGKNVVDYLSIRPGLTGRWQVMRKRETTFDERVQMDVDYARNRSFVTDLAIIMATPIALISSNATT